MHQSEFEGNQINSISKKVNVLLQTSEGPAQPERCALTAASREVPAWPGVQPILPDPCSSRHPNRSWSRHFLSTESRRRFQVGSSVLMSSGRCHLSTFCSLKFFVNEVRVIQENGEPSRPVLRSLYRRFISHLPSKPQGPQGPASSTPSSWLLPVPPALA